MQKVKIAVIGAGCRGMYAYGPYLLENPHLGEVVAVAEPIKEKRDLFKEMYNIKEDNLFITWHDLLSKDKIADAIIIANNDEGHYEPAKLALEKGYHVLLEKPMSNDLEKVIKLGELAKSCHDLDILLWLTGSRCKYISSFGSLSHMKEESFKDNMSDKCVDCKQNNTCPYSAHTIYLEEDKIVRSLNAVHPNPTKINLKEALNEGPYGRCIYKCDNDVVDHMVSILEFENKVTATFNLSAFTEECSRTIKLMFTHGEIGGNFTKNIIDIHKFGTNTHTKLSPKVNPSGHRGGDYSLIADFINNINNNEKELRTSAIQSVDSHIMAFAAEYSRLNHKVININAFYNNEKIM